MCPEMLHDQQFEEMQWAEVRISEKSVLPSCSQASVACGWELSMTKLEELGLIITIL